VIEARYQRILPKRGSMWVAPFFQWQGRIVRAWPADMPLWWMQEMCRDDWKTYHAQ
jgi:hypothetical protein